MGLRALDLDCTQTCVSSADVMMYRWTMWSLLDVILFLGNVSLGTTYVLVVLVILPVVENPAAIDCFDREQVV